MNRLRLLIPTLLLAVFAALFPGPGAASAGERPEATEKLVVTFLDMKAHGLAVVLQTPAGKTYLVDTGHSAKDYDCGRDTVAPFLKAQGVQEIAGIAISHPHADHYGGASWLLDHFKVKQFIDSGYVGRDKTQVHRDQMAAYNKLRQQAKDRGAEYIAAHAGDRLNWGDGIEVEALSPSKEFFSLDTDPQKVSDHGLINANSLVLRVRHGKNVFLFPGDAYGGAFEEHLLHNTSRDKILATVVAAPHHGFNPGVQFPELAKPSVVIASCLPDYPSNAFFPYPRSPGDHATKVFAKVGAKVYTTGTHGNVRVTSDGKTYTVQTDREGKTASNLRLKWEKNLLTIRGNFPGEVITVNYLEAYCRPGSTDRDWKETVIGHRTELVSASDDQRRIRLKCRLNDGVIAEHDIYAMDNAVDFRIMVTNPTAQESQAHWAQPCIRLKEFTGRTQQDYLEKSFIFLDGKLSRMPTRDWAAKARYVPGQVWSPRHVDRNDVNPRPLSPNVPSNGLIGCYSSDDKWLFATAFEPYQELFQGVITCLHSDFRIGGLKPGETKKIRGKIYIMPADVDALLKRYETDFPEHVKRK